MSNGYFRFKQFTVYQDQCAMKVGIDGVLLGSWVKTEYSKRILDIGSGTGLIALMIAQRSDSFIDAIDIDEKAVFQAKENVSNSPWSNRISVQKISLQDFVKKKPEPYDLIVSNPPYFNNSTKAPTDNRTLARHTDSLSHEELIENAILLLKPTGRICIILPVVESLHCISYALNKGLFCSKHCSVYPTPGSRIKRVLIEFSQQNTERITTELTIENGIRHQYSPQFIEMAKEYYLKL